MEAGRPATEKLRERLEAGDAACPNCGYNLRTLTDIRCPECGYVLAVELLAAASPAQARPRGVRYTLLVLALCSVAVGAVTAVRWLMPGGAPVSLGAMLVRALFALTPAMIFVLWLVRPVLGARRGRVSATDVVAVVLAAFFLVLAVR